jgi:hypothetical protein
MPSCYDCKWCEKKWWLLSKKHRFCLHPSVTLDELSANQMSYFQKRSIGVERSVGTTCGPEGKLWSADAPSAEKAITT